MLVQVLGDIEAEGMGVPLSWQVILRVAFCLQMLGCLVLEISLRQPGRGFISLWLEKFSLTDALPHLQDGGPQRSPMNADVGGGRSGRTGRRDRWDTASKLGAETIIDTANRRERWERPISPHFRWGSGKLER